MSNRMSDRKFIKPVGDAPVPKADGTPLNPAGEILPLSGWWHRRKAEGAVTIGAVATHPSSKKSTRSKGV